MFNTVEQGRRAAELMPDIIDRVLAGLPIPRRMRWGASEAEFVRPVHWVVMLHGKEVVDASVVETAEEAVESRCEALVRQGQFLRALEIARCQGARAWELRAASSLSQLKLEAG